ncbi:TonB-dependent receptor [Rhodanobacter sp. 7MK24]|uniref:TonB-dependent receptor n=1 Tax=Rhodanobacter sp. 7MK24 TaxID=2775922 RepID=UPI00177D7DE1|nr:TonB-dependent receptor [Rhodanobacter sp. 7MK24]MBD8878867.1 TonB-dependent receptor [Rhodanobacter sp. 7MK24]
MSARILTSLTLSAAIAAALASGTAQAQDNGQNASSAPTVATNATQKAKSNAKNGKSVQSLEQVVVTGSASNAGVRKIDASYSITTATDAQIQQINPRSAADLLKLSPGVWPESSGGETGANVEIAGFPGGGDAPFYTNQIMGTPLYGMPSLSFFEQSSMFRLDDTVDHVELLQGGPSVVFGDGQIGLTSNYILKQGTDTPSGDIGVTYGTGDLRRIDGFYGFPIGKNGWYGSVGGFYRDSNGVRDPQYAADKGGQLTATLTKDWDNGSLVFWTRGLDDKNQFITPVPLIQDRSGIFSDYPGFDPLTSTYYSSAMQHTYLESYPGGGTGVNLANGRGAQLGFFGVNFDWDFGDGWTVSDKFLVDGGNMDTNALFSGSNPQSLSSWENTAGTYPDNTVPTGAVYNASYTNGTGTITNPNLDVISQGLWHIHKNLHSVINDFRVSRDLFDGNTLTAGLYLAHYTDDDRWSLGNPMLMTNTPNATPIAVSYEQGGKTYYVTNSQGLIYNGGYNITENGESDNKAFYLSDTWKLDQWIFDASARVENENARNTVCNLSNVNIDGNAYTLYDNAVAMCNGSYSVTDYDKTHTSWTLGATYKLSDDMAIYARANKGAHFNSFDDMRGNTTGNTPPLLTIQNFEVGYKYSSDLLSADLAFYHRQFNGLSYQPSILGVPLGGYSTYGSDTKGLNFAVRATTPDQVFSISASGDWMQGHYSHFEGDAVFYGLPTSDNPTGEFVSTYEGKQLQRQPKFQVRITPSLHFSMPQGDLRLWATMEYVGPHTQDQLALQQLGSYTDFNVGAQYTYDKHWVFTLLGSNVTDTLGLTESNSRIAGNATDASGVLLARTLEGHQYTFQVKYQF